LRIVSKSLPVVELLGTVMDGTGSNQLMVFNGVMLEALCVFRPAADLLLGRPLPVVQVAAFVRQHVGDARPAARPQWLVDSLQRLSQYLEVAKANQTTLRVNFEIDVGLHRGGFADGQALAAAIEMAQASKCCEITGLMGYDAHVVAVPFQDAALRDSLARYREAREVLQAHVQRDAVKLTLNTAGSPTYRLHLDDRIANEVAIGSGFVKPMDFDIPTLTQHIPAAFIAEPVLKALDPAQIPTIERFTPLINAWDPNSRQGFFLYGGYGDAEPVSPAGLEFSALYEHHALLTGSSRVGLRQDDFVFMRPHESEGTFLQYGDAAVYDGGEIVARWPTFPIAA